MSPLVVLVPQLGHFDPRWLAIASQERVDLFRVLLEQGEGLAFLARLGVLECLEVLDLALLLSVHVAPEEVLLDGAHLVD